MTSTLQADFDRIALLYQKEIWDHNSHYHGYLLRHLPPQMENVLDVGCGTGTFTRLLGQRSKQVTGVDLSPEMINVAQAHTHAMPNIRYLTADIMALPLQTNHFDCISSIATLHHLPLSEIVPKLADAIKPGGVLLILDLYEEDSPWAVSTLMRNALAVCLHKALLLTKTGRLQASPEVRAAWAEHGKHDQYMKLSEITRLAQALLPGSQVTRHLLWRYSLVWRKSVNFPVV